MAANRRLDRARARRRPALDEGEVLALDQPAREQRLQRAQRLLRARHHQQPGRVAVEAMHDSRTLRLASTRARRQQLRERSFGVAA
jgi:hypothetical protein